MSDTHDPGPAERCATASPPDVIITIVESRTERNRTCRLSCEPAACDPTCVGCWRGSTGEIIHRIRYVRGRGIGAVVLVVARPRRGYRRAACAAPGSGAGRARRPRPTRGRAWRSWSPATSKRVAAPHGALLLTDLLMRRLKMSRGQASTRPTHWSQSDCRALYSGAWPRSCARDRDQCWDASVRARGRANFAGPA